MKFPILSLKRTFTIVTLLFVLVAAITCGVGFTSYRLSRISSQHAGDLTSRNLPALQELARLQEATLRYMAANTEFVLAKDEASMAAKARGAAEFSAQAATHLKMLGDLVASADVAKLSADFQSALGTYDAAVARLQAALKGGDFEKAMALLDNDVAKSDQALEVTLTSLSQHCFAISNEAGGAAAAAVSRNLRVTLTLTAVSGSIILFAVIFVPIIARRVSLRIGENLDSLSSGSEQVRSGAQSLASGSQSLADDSSKQAASLEETGASLVEMGSMTKNNAESAQKAKQTAANARVTADLGAAQMASMQTAMVEINHASTEITKILKTIDDIAFQTNILALNAAVEAARAGEAGLGFAVVAEEVRSLAQRSAQAAKETAVKIENSVAKSGEGMRHSAEARESFDVIQKQVRELDGLMSEIAAACSEQNDGIAQVNSAVSEMDRVTQSTAANAEETASAAEELNSQAVTLHDAINVLKALAGTRPTATQGTMDFESGPEQPIRNAPRSAVPRAVLQSRISS